ncbi:uncharacterized protein BXZ73DRAFT_80670 [Epithele typhae]|uniref:uncharacterized protein n=1 Tax=Epithele typhae TaxID=378194 RepID=UPI00200755B2|nr:uncharacterized protein BXZ73DRAFT_80670 [Epithele typhae]KAH9918209.1 hypothetical protein BXZ73DRAFT_80670 [Epithele typhae]
MYPSAFCEEVPMHDRSRERAMEGRHRARHLSRRASSPYQLGFATFPESRRISSLSQFSRSPPSSATTSPQTDSLSLSPPPTVTSFDSERTRSSSPPHSEVQLSIYSKHTATYAWPKFEYPPKEGQPPARIYVQYRKSPSDVDSNSSSSSSPAAGLHLVAGAHRAPSSSLPLPRAVSTPARSRVSSSPESDICSYPSSPSDRFLKHRRVTTSDMEAATRERSSRDQTALDALHALRIDVPGSRAPAGLPTSAEQPAPLAALPVAITAVGQTAEKAAEWTKHAEDRGEEGFVCTWTDDFTPNPCGYKSKKHLVKRHINSKHLQRKPCICPFCEKGFAQKSNLMTHMNTHTGNAPHKCQYCNTFFKDPARRHRHMLQDHQHVSSRTKKGRMLARTQDF